MLSNIRKLLRHAMWLPFHPQWFTRKEPQLLQLLRNNKDGDLILDIGCADKWIQQHLPPEVGYIGLDYPSTSTNLYKTLPDVFGNAERLPFASSSINKIYFLDVLEHIENPAMALSEARRVLRTDGEIVVRIPFLYPIHDAPIDFTRFTMFGLQSVIKKCGLELMQATAIGHPFETTALLRNLAYSKALLDLIVKRNPLCLIGVILPLYFFVNNTFSFLMARITPATTIMPHTYLLSLRKMQ